MTEVLEKPSMLRGVLQSGCWRRSLLAATGFVALLFAIRALLDPWAADDPAFVLFLSAVTAAAYFGGLLGGMFALVLSLPVAWFFTRLDAANFFANPILVTKLVAFCVEGVLISVLCGMLHHHREQARRAAAEAEQLQRQVSDAAEREQRRIGQDLHDDLGQFLTGIALAGENVATRLDRGGSATASEARKLVAMVNAAVNRTRQLARGLAPMTPDGDSLPLLLAELQERSAELSGRKITFDRTGEIPDLPQDTCLQLYRIAQEAVGNSLKHSGAERIELSMDCLNDRLTIRVRDNGRTGFNPEEVRQHPRGMGLKLMQFRAKSIGAELTIRPREESPGTEMSCVLPISGAGTDGEFGERG